MEEIPLQQVMDSFIIYASQQNATNLVTQEIESTGNPFGPHSTLKIPWTQFSPSDVRLAPFPTREYTDDEFQSIIKKVMGVLYLLGFLYPISRLISYSVLEKEQKIKEGLYMMGLKDEMFHLSWFITYALQEQKIKEGLYMMGLKDEMFHLSWFITYALQFAVSSAIITVSTLGTLFEYSDKSVVFMYFFSFGLSAIMLSFLISTFFTRAKTAVAVGTLSFLGAFFPYYTVNDEAVSMIVKVIASLLSPTAFALGSINFADYERAHVGLRWSNIWRASSGVCFLACLLMMLLDALLYCVIGLYLDKVLHKENGVRYPWDFLFCKCFWRKNNRTEHQACSSEVNIIGEHSKEKANFSEKDIHEPALEATSLDMKQNELDGRCIQIGNLHKVYTAKKGKICAVNNLQLTLYENQILALLGHNGAGKSTTISMLVGLLPPTSGDALVFGKSILTDMDEIRKNLGVCPQYDILFPELTDEIRKNLGVCPQYDILFPELTGRQGGRGRKAEDLHEVKEHMVIFANLKGVDEDSLESNVTEMVDEVSFHVFVCKNLTGICYHAFWILTCVSETMVGGSCS
ncbi:unnamed protein product [Ilex paraguariensis]|uniref:ABC transporter domain-containing protein n=1 Tax=Ilex paraguariensis TaxID=185542 RepID=A0ABC8SEG7_9AQUA